MTFFTYGFRPFFLSAGLYAVLAVVAWAAHLESWLEIPNGFSPSFWHAHEMIFGYAAAAMAGFFLTATPNWSGRPPLTGTPLVALFALWLAGRYVMWFPTFLPSAFVAIVDIAFIPALALAVFPALVGNIQRQGVFLAVFAVLIAGNVFFHLDAFSQSPFDPQKALVLSLDGLLILMTIIGGRVVPSFTANYLRSLAPPAQQISHPVIERGTLVLTGLVIVLDAIDLTQEMGVVALLGALFHGIRLAGWKGHRTHGAPIVWVLHVGYAWIPIALALRGLAGLELADSALAGIHALGVGAVGTLTLAVMSRAALGHTGRPLHASAGTVGAYVLVIIAAALRVVTALDGPIPAEWGYGLSAAVWAGGFALFTLIYLPVLIRPRVD